LKPFFLLIFKNFALAVIEDGAVESGDQYLGKHGWNKGKHL